MRIAIDDFGTGYSSLHTLQRLPIDMLKMAKSFVDDDGLAFQTTILQLARALDVTVVAEGIESEAQLERLRELGCDMGQGFHLSPPVSGVALLDQPLSQILAAARGRARPRGRVSHGQAPGLPTLHSLSAASKRRADARSSQRQRMTSASRSRHGARQSSLPRCHSS